MTAPALRPGAVAWRINDQSGAPLRCIVVRLLAGGFVLARSSTFSCGADRVVAENVFADRDACRAEIRRRRALAEAQLTETPT